METYISQIPRGTFTCYVYAITPVAAASVLSMVQDTIDTTVAFPLTGTAVNPDLVGITLATTITLVAGSTQTDKDTAAGQAAAAAQDYLNNLRVGDPLIKHELRIGSGKEGAGLRLTDAAPGHLGEEVRSLLIGRQQLDWFLEPQALLPRAGTPRRCQPHFLP